MSGRVAVVTGGADGIGRGIVRRLAADGARVLLADIDAERGREAAAEAERDADVAVVFHQVDVTDRAAVERMIAVANERFGAVDILVNNAWSGTTLKRIEYKTDAEMLHGMTMAMSAALWAMQAAFPAMKARGWGRIVNIGSLNGVNAHIGSAEYNVCKEALRALSRTAAREWAGHGITCNIVCPASISAAYRRFRDANPETAAIMAAQNPMGRMGDPDADIAPVVAFLASEGSRYLTGNTLFVDGGAHINGVAWAPELPDGP
ncbi:SDR family NAD(P)-dependent oxidoreductase [Sphingomonas paeninsulae]|uniref:SDR family NAD(P)-dependent oxidoreductase n=1 Tax=Sphingomonas paeninsulae TaxID=2319844 RepID=UPI001EF0575A|nr:SDR family NAD(P)-dependent oxidoreductase [Sphingomonas paeninsulae]